MTDTLRYVRDEISCWLEITRIMKGAQVEFLSQKRFELTSPSALTFKHISD
jgi:hypothetical protein